ncbi:Transcriptional coactivator p15 (PC4) C-terminal domain-containing protein [Entamoeba marina]
MSDNEKAPKKPVADNDEKKVDKKDAKNSNLKFTLSSNYMCLSGKKYVYQNEFKGVTYLNIREMYEKDGELKPGNKGVALKKEEWKTLCDHLEEIQKWLS